jgi:hypothetical protein
MSEDDGQVDGHAPLLEAAVLVSQNCEPCRGTGYRVRSTRPVASGHDPIGAPWDGRDAATPDVPTNTVPCEDCEGAGRQVHEVPLSELAQMLQQAATGPRAPSPSELRGR